MKRLVWLILAAFSTALAQVQPVDVRLLPKEKCDCCEQSANACGMPDCAPAPACAQAALQLPAPAQIAVAKRTIPAPSATAREPFYVQFLPRVIVAPALPVADAVAPAASAPLYQAHCSFLI
jgi:hypothetical protein